TRFSRDWSSDVCSSDLPAEREHPPPLADEREPRSAEGPALSAAGGDPEVGSRPPYTGADDRRFGARSAAARGGAAPDARLVDGQIGRASCRDTGRRRGV